MEPETKKEREQTELIQIYATVGLKEDLTEWLRDQLHWGDEPNVSAALRSLITGCMESGMGLSRILEFLETGKQKRSKT